MDNARSTNTKHIADAKLTLPSYDEANTHVPVSVKQKPRFGFFKGVYYFGWCWLLSRALIKDVIPALSSLHTWVLGELEFPIPSGIRIEHCSEWSQPNMKSSNQVTPYYQSANFQLPTNLDSLFLISRGSLSYGDITVVQSDTVSETAALKVEVEYWDDSVLEHVMVCEVSRGANERGLGIFTPDWPERRRPHRYRPYFKVSVELPQSSGDSPLAVNAFETDLPMFKHEVGNLAGHVNFQNLTLRTANLPISVESATAETIIVRNANAAIRGSFNTSSSISLRTVNAYIDVNLEMLNTNQTRATTAELITSNSYITALINLSTSSDNGTGGNFSVDASTARGKVDIEFSDAPTDSILNLEAVTALDSVDVHLHRSYQGSFKLQTALAFANLEVNDKVEDPSGDGKKRQIDINKVSRANVEGSVWWSEEKKAIGSVALKSSLAPVSLSV